MEYRNEICQVSQFTGVKFICCTSIHVDVDVDTAIERGTKSLHHEGLREGHPPHRLALQ